MITNGTIIQNRQSAYKVIKQLGKGSYSVVYQVQNGKNPTYLAMKTTSLETTKLDEINLQRETDLLFQNNFPNILKVHAQFIFSQNDQQYHVIVMEELEPLKKWMDKNIISQDDRLQFTVNFLTECMLCLQYFQTKRVVHRDLKLDNIMLKVNPQNPKEYIIRITDFNLSKCLENNLQQSIDVGNKACRAPETFKQPPNYEATDIWAVGIMVRALVEERYDVNFPYSEKHNKDFGVHCVNYLQRLPLGQVDPMPEIPLFFKSFVTMCMELDSVIRIKFVEKFLKHPDLQDLIALRQEFAKLGWAK